MPSSLDDLVAAARARIARFAPADAAAAMARGAVLLDLRPGAQRARDGEVPGAIVVARNALEWRICRESGWADPRLPDRDGTPILLCAHGAQSSLAAAGLVDLGFPHAADVDGGFEAWRAAGLPVVPRGHASVLRAVAGGPGSELAALDPYAEEVG